MNMLVSGASGLIGSGLVPMLAAQGCSVIELRRVRAGDTVPRPAGAFWDPAVGQVSLDQVGPLDAVVHLAGENIARRWTPAVKTRIRVSRVNGTRLLSEALAAMPCPPQTLVCASATGFYGNRGEELLDERSSAGSGFLAETCQEWERAAEPVRQRGLRVVHLRFGVVLTPRGGALARMLPPFRAGLGGPIGDGSQYWSWIVIEDLLDAILHSLRTDSLSGPVNVVAPNPVTNREFSAALGRALRRPVLLPLPAFLVALLFGQMGREVLLGSARVQPARLLQSGFQFRFPQIAPALEHLLS